MTPPPQRVHACFFFGFLPPTCGLRSKTEGVVAIVPLVFCSVAADPGEQPHTAGRPRLDDGIVHGAIAEPPSVAPVQALRPGCKGQSKGYITSRILNLLFWAICFIFY